MTAINQPIPVFTDLDGLPLEAGYLFFGASNLNPETTPITVYWDEALTIPAAQPIRTIAGYPSRGGNPSRIFSGSDYSVTVRDKNQQLVVYIANISAGSTSTTAPVEQGFFEDEPGGANIHRFRDRVFIGDSTLYTGNRFGVNGYGASWITNHAASWIIKNSVFSASTEDGNAGIAILGASRTAPGVTPTLTNCGVAGLTLNEGTATFGRAFYGEVLHKSTGGTSVGLEIQVGNFTGDVPVANAYTMAASRVNGLYVGVESGTGYTTGDADTLIGPGLNAAGAAIDIAGGSLSAAYQHWTTGIVFRNGALSRDGSGFGVAISMAQKHKLQWEISATETGASIWSEVVDPIQKVGLKFENRSVTMVGVSDRTILKSTDDLSGAGAVNYPVIKNSRTGIAVSFGAEGTDAVVSTDIYSKSTGAVRLMSHGGTGENLRIVPPAGAPTDYLTIAGSAGGTLATIGTAGASANIDIRFLPKGTGVLRFGAWVNTGDVAINGYVTIKTDDGVARKLATVA